MSGHRWTLVNEIFRCEACGERGIPSAIITVDDGSVKVWPPYVGRCEPSPSVPVSPDPDGPWWTCYGPGPTPEAKAELRDYAEWLKLPKPKPEFHAWRRQQGGKEEGNDNP